MVSIDEPKMTSSIHEKKIIIWRRKDLFDGLDVPSLNR